MTTVRKSVRFSTRARLMVSAGTVLPLIALALPAHADPIVEQSDSDITVSADSASGTPIAVELFSSGGSIDASVTEVTGTTVSGDRDYVVGLETEADGAITGSFDSITATGGGEVLGLGATSVDGDILLDVGTLDVNGAASAGIAAISTNGDIGITADSVISRGTGEDSQHEFYEAVFGQSLYGSVTLNVGTSETSGVYASALNAIAGQTASITGDTATSNSDNSVTVYAKAGDAVAVDVGSIVHTSTVGGQGTYLESTNGGASLTAGTITVGNWSEAARIKAAGDVSVDIGTLTGGKGLQVQPTSGDVTITIGSAETYASAINASTVSGGNLAISVGDVTSHNGDTATIIANAMGGGSLSVSADSASGAGVDHATIEATTDTGDITIAAGDVSASGNGGMGVLAQSTDGDVDVSVDTVATTGLDTGLDYTPDGVAAISTNGTATVTLGSGTTEGKYSTVAAAAGGAGAHVTVGEASGAGLQGAVVYARSTGGDSTVDAGTVTMRGDQQGAIQSVADNGVANVNVDSIVNAGTNGSGILARGAAGANIAAGSIEADRYGAWANATNGGDASIVTSGDTTVTAGYGLRGTGANVSITTAADSTTEAGGNAIWAQAGESATIANGGTARTTGGIGSAIYATSGGSVSITSANAEATGPGADPGGDGNGMRIAQGGIVASATGPVSIDADTVTVEGEYRYGISATSDAAISIVANTVDLESADSVAVVARGGAGDVSITTGTVTTTGASGVGVFGHTSSGAITINAGTTRVENEGMQGQFTGDAVIATSGNGSISITSDNAFSAALYGTAVAGISGGDVTIVSNVAETTGDGGAAIFGQSNAGILTMDLGSIVTSGDGAGAINAFAYNGTGNVTIGDIATTGASSVGLTGVGRVMNVTVNGDVATTGRGILASSGVEANITINGSVTTSESNAPAVVTVSNHGVVTIAEGASVNGGGTGVVMLGTPQGGFSEFYNSGTVHGTAGPAVVGIQTDPTFVPANFYLQNNGTVSADGGVAVVTGAGDDTLELTENSVIEGIANLGDGWDHLVLDFNDDAPADAVGQVVSTVNVEMLSVDTGNWRAEGPTSFYNELEIEDGASLTIAQYDGYSSILTNYVDLGGTLNLDFSTDTEPGDLSGLLIDGAGSLHLIGTATILVDDASGLQYTGGTFVENGTLLLTDVYGGDIATSGDGTFQLGDGGTTGDFTGDIVNNGTFVFSRSDDYSLLGTFSGSGSLIKDGAGTLTFAGLFDFTGTTLVNAGVLAFAGELAPDATLDLSGSGTVDLSKITSGTQTIAGLTGSAGNLILGTTSLIINQTGDSVFGGMISGTGTLTKEGAGNLNLTGDSTFSGNAYVNDGKLSVNGSYANANFFVGEGGTLGGNGAMGSTTVQGGTLAAGNSIGHLTVAGDLTFNSASTLVVEVDPAGNADLVSVTGTATLGGATVNVLAGAGVYAPVTNYTILTAAGGLSGTFGTVNTNLAYLVPLLSYTVDTVTLRLSRNDVDYSTYAATPNQAVIGNLIEALGYGTTLYDTTLVMARADVPGDFETLTGGVYPSYAGALVETADMLRRQTMQAPRSGSGPYAWATGLLGNVKGSAGTGISGFKADNTGVAGGLGYAMAGFDVSAGVGYLSQDPNGSQVNDSSVTFATLQAAYDSPVGFKLRAGVQLGWFDAKSSRTTSLGTINNSLSGALKGDYTQYYGEVAFAVPSIAVSIEPFAGISHLSLNVDKFTETGGATALTVNGLDRDVTFGDLGLRVSLPLPGGITPYASGSYRYAWGDRASLASVAFAGNTTSGVVTGLPIAKGAAEVEAGLRYTGGMIELGLGYSGSFSKTFDSNTAKLTATLKF